MGSWYCQRKGTSTRNWVGAWEFSSLSVRCLYPTVQVVVQICVVLVCLMLSLLLLHNATIYWAWGDISISCIKMLCLFPFFSYSSGDLWSEQSVICCKGTFELLSSVCTLVHILNPWPSLASGEVLLTILKMEVTRIQKTEWEEYNRVHPGLKANLCFVISKTQVFFMFCICNNWIILYYKGSNSIIN